MQTFKVLRDHFGDRAYVPGDLREADFAEVAHLVAKGVLVSIEAAVAPETKVVTDIVTGSAVPLQGLTQAAIATKTAKDSRASADVRPGAVSEADPVKP